MRILFLAPQPFFQERGTPIAVRLALEVLAGAGRDQIDLLTYHEGTDIHISGVTNHRITVPQVLRRWLRNLGPGLTIRKLACDVLFLIAAVRLVRAARTNPYSIIHAVEEAVFIALFIKWIFGIPYVYDMDSSLALQVTEKWSLLKPLAPVLGLLEKLAVRQSLAVVPVCDALAAIARGHGSEETHVLHDISLLNTEVCDAVCDLRDEGSIASGDLILLYIGNLERYQGIDLLLESFSRIVPLFPNATLAIIGGRVDHIALYLEQSKHLQIESRVRFLGPRSVSNLGLYLEQADVLVSPRVKGNNTPMKIYSYLHSGKAIVATALPTHTQVMDSSVAMLSAPEAGPYADALLAVLRSKELRDKLGASAYALAHERYTFDTFSKQLQAIYGRVNTKVMASEAKAATS